MDQVIIQPEEVTLSETHVSLDQSVLCYENAAFFVYTLFFIVLYCIVLCFQYFLSLTHVNMYMTQNKDGQHDSLPKVKPKHLILIPSLLY